MASPVPYAIPTPTAIDALNDHAYEMRHQDTRQALAICLEARALATKIDYQRGMAQSLFLTSLCQFILGQNEHLIESSLQAAGRALIMV